MKKKAISIALILVVILGISALPAFAAGGISLDKTTYAPNEQITVTATGITEQMIKDEAWVSIFKAGAVHNTWGEYHKPQASTDTLTFTAPSETGTYEMRLYSKDHLSDYGTVFVTQVPFTVGTTTTASVPATTTTTTSGINVLLDGKALTFDVPPQLINNRTMVPLRAIFEAMGAKVDWDGDTETVTGTKDSTVVILKIGDTSPTINGTVVTIDQPGVIVNDRTLAPLRFVAEAFGGIVDWDDSTQTASITMGGTAATTPKPEPTPPTTLPPETTNSPETTQPQSGSNSSGIPQGNTGIIGVWMAMSTRTSGTYAHIIFYEDGTFLFAAPAKGLYNFDKEQDKVNRQGDNFWGTYTLNGNTGTWKYDATSLVSELSLEADGGLILTSTYSKFYRCSSVDNFRINGSYTSYADPSDPNLSMPGEKAVIRFSSDGTFVDEGLFTNIYSYLGISTGKTKEDFASGYGTYELKDFSLILRYSDGRVIQTFFSFFINGKDASDYVCIDSRLLLTQMP